MAFASMSFVVSQSGTAFFSSSLNDTLGTSKFTMVILRVVNTLHPRLPEL